MYVSPAFSVVIVSTDDRAMYASVLGRCSRRMSVSSATHPLSRPRYSMTPPCKYEFVFFSLDSSGQL